MRLKDKVAVVTGGGAGFGEAMARRFAAEGARVLIADLNEQAGARVAGEIGAAAAFEPADVSDGAAIARLVERAEAAFGGLDIFVSNAGYSYTNKPMTDVTEAEFDRVFAVNVKSIFHAAVHATPAMRRRGGGSFINIASTGALRPRPGLTWYNGSKGAVVTITKGMAVELAPDQIRVNALCPVFSPTGMAELFLGKPNTEENRAGFVATIPLGRPSAPDDIASAALYLASDEAAFITGVALEVDGGRCI